MDRRERQGWGPGYEHAHVFVGRHVFSQRRYSPGAEPSTWAWKRVSETEYHASYIAFRFDNSGKWNGFARTRIQVLVGPDGNTFTGLAKSSARDLQDKELGSGESKLVGKRITVEPF